MVGDGGFAVGELWRGAAHRAAGMTGQGTTRRRGPSLKMNEASTGLQTMYDPTPHVGLGLAGIPGPSVYLVSWCVGGDGTAARDCAATQGERSADRSPQLNREHCRPSSYVAAH